MTERSQSLVKELVQEFDKQFSRETLENSPYYVHKLTGDLKLKLNDIFKNKRIKYITENKDAIKEALGKCQKVGILEDGNTAVLKLSKKKQLVLTNPGSENQMEDFKSFLEGVCESLKIKNTEIKFASSKTIQISFSEEKQATDLFKELKNQSFKGQGIKDMAFESEDILTSLQNSVRKYEASKKSQQQQQQIQQPSQGGAQSEQEQQYLQQQQAQQYQNYQQMCQLQMFYYQQAQMFQASNENFTHVMQQKDFSDLFIRRADKDKSQQQQANGQKKQQRGRKGNQITSGFDQAYEVNTMYSCLPPPFLDPMMGMNGSQQQRNNRKGNRQQRGNHHRQNNNNNEQNRNEKRSKSRKRSNDHSQSRQTLRNRSKSQNNNNNNNQKSSQNNGKRGNYQKNSKQNKSNNNIRNTSNSVNNRSTSRDVYVKKHNRPRLDSDNFPVLHEKNDKGEMTPVQYIQKPQKPTVKPTSTPYLENKAKISKKYTHFEIITSFERWKAEKVMNENLNNFLTDTTIPVILGEPIGKLEIEQPHRKNSSAVTPLLTGQPTMQLRKGSAHYSSSQSPNKKQSTRKFSSQK